MATRPVNPAGPIDASKLRTRRLQRTNPQRQARASNRRATLRRVFGFLDVDTAFDNAQFDQAHNARESKVRYNDLGMWLIRRGWFTEKTSGVRGPLVPPLRRLLSRPIETTLSTAVRDRVHALLMPEVEKLERLTGFTPRRPWQ